LCGKRLCYYVCMTTQTRNRILTSIFLLILTVLVSELSYFYFNYRRHQNLNTTVATPPSTTSTSLSTPTPTPTPTSSPTSTSIPTLNPLSSKEILTRQSLNKFFGVIPNNLNLISELGLKIVTEGYIQSLNETSITMLSLDKKSTFHLNLSSTTLSKLQIILPDKIAHSLLELSPGMHIRIESLYTLTPPSKIYLKNFTIIPI